MRTGSSQCAQLISSLSSTGLAAPLPLLPPPEPPTASALQPRTRAMPDQPEELEPPSRFRLSDVQTRAGDKCARSEGPQRVVDVLVDVLDAGGLRSRACVQQREIKPSDGEHAEQAWSGCGVLTGIISLKYSEPDDRQMCDDLPLQRIAAPL